MQKAIRVNKVRKAIGRELIEVQSTNWPAVMPYYTDDIIMVNIPGLAEPAEAFRTYYKCSVDPNFVCPF